MYSVEKCSAINEFHDMYYVKKYDRINYFHEVNTYSLLVSEENQY